MKEKKVKAKAVPILKYLLVSSAPVMSVLCAVFFRFCFPVSSLAICLIVGFTVVGS